MGGGNTVESTVGSQIQWQTLVFLCGQAGAAELRAPRALVQPSVWGDPYRQRLCHAMAGAKRGWTHGLRHCANYESVEPTATLFDGHMSIGE